MNVRFNVAELVGVVAKTLSSIDVRTASVLIEGKWQNVMTVVRLSCDSAVTVSARVEEIWGKHGPVHTDEFRIDCKVLAFTEWAELLAEFNKGEVWFAETGVEFGRAVDVGGSLGYVQSNHNALWPESDWPTLETSVQISSVPDAAKNPQYKINAEHIQRAVSKSGYSGTLDAMVGLLGIKINSGITGFDVYVAVPVMAKVTGAAVSPGEDLVEATGCCHPALGSFRVFGSSYGGTQEPKERMAFHVEDSPSSDTLRRFIGKGQVPASKIKDFLEVKFVHGELGEIHSHTWRTRDLIPEQYVNPLYFLLHEVLFSQPTTFAGCASPFGTSTKNKAANGL